MTFPPDDRGTNLAIWAIIWIALIAWQAVTVRSGRVPGFGVLVRAARRFWVTRWALLAAWAWLGWHLFARTHF